MNGTVPGVIGATIGGGGSSSPGFERPNHVEANYGTISGGLGNAIGERSRDSTIGGGAGNTIRADSGWSTISGGEANTITLNARYSTISGGGLNTASGYGGVIGGGSLNTVQTNAEHSSIGGGLRNRIAANAMFSTIAGGNANLAAILGATVGGGEGNQASNLYSVVSGGTLNQGTGDYSAVPGGLRNKAGGPCSFAAGRQANALHLGAFVWSDASGHEASRPYTFDSVTTNEFAVRATGGARFVTAIDATGSNIAGVSLAPGSGSWSSLSDRNAKENFAAANPREILDKVAALPMASWNYKAQGASARHLGPMAQDFHAAFGLGENERTITTVDADGVALAAIQGLNEKVDSENTALRAELHRRDAENAELRQQLTEIQAMLRELAAKRGNQP